MEPKQELMRLEKTLELVNFWIDKADTKVNISLGLFPLLTAVMNYLNSMIIFDEKPNSCLLFDILNAISVFLIITSIVFYVLALMPKLGSSGSKKQKKYPLYHGDIFRLKLNEYKAVITKADESDYADELMNEIHFNSSICHSKMINFKIGITLSIISVLVEIVCFVLFRFVL